MPQGRKGRKKPRQALKVESPYCDWCGGEKRTPSAKYCSGRCGEMAANPDAPWTEEEVRHRARAVRQAALLAEMFSLSDERRLELERQFEAMRPADLVQYMRETA